MAVCEQCGKLGIPYDQKFCSRLCFFESRKRIVVVSCAACSAPIHCTPSRAKKYKLHFCDQTCISKYNAQKRRKPKYTKCQNPQCRKILKHMYTCINRHGKTEYHFLFDKKFCNRACSVAYQTANAEIAAKRSASSKERARKRREDIARKAQEAGLTLEEAKRLL